ncbi:MAG: glycosyltransferase, partial [Acidobacteria bacterium]
MFSHKLCWREPGGRDGYATDGGFPFQMRALAGLFDSTTLVLPCRRSIGHGSNTRLSGHNLTVVPLTVPKGQGVWHKMMFPLWMLRNMPVLIRETLRADAVHSPIPGDVGTIGMLLAVLFRKPLFVRHCGNWSVQTTHAEHFWKSFMQLMAGGTNVMLATGGGPMPPSERNSALRWIFSSACTERELEAARERAAGRKPGHRLIIACRQDREKGTGIAIESVSHLLRDLPDVALDVVGDGPALEQWRQLAASLGLADRITFHGKVAHDRVLDLLQQADLFCYPTAASEGFPKIV